jgi:hypothetical protein
VAPCCREKEAALKEGNTLPQLTNPTEGKTARPLPYSLTPRGRILPKIKRHLTGKPARKTSLKKIYVEVTLKNQQLSELRYHPSWSNHVG